MLVFQKKTGTGAVWAPISGVTFSTSEGPLTSLSGSIGFAWKPDGTRLYAGNNDGATDLIREYSMSSAWDISTLTLLNSGDVNSETAAPADVAFKTDGTKMYVLSSFSPTATIFQYTLSSAWDVSSLSYDSVSFSAATQQGGAESIVMSPDGTGMYITGWSPAAGFQYTLSTPWDLSTASYASKSLSFSEANNPRGIQFNNDGTKVYLAGSDEQAVFQYTMSTPYDLSTGSYDTVSADVSAQVSAPNDVDFKPDGSKMYVWGDNETVYEYDL